MPVDLNLAVTLIGSVTLNLESGVYSVGAESRTTAQAGQRAHRVSSPYIDGEWTIHSVRENVTEQLDVYITGTTHLQARQALQALEAQLSRPTFTIRWDFVDDVGTTDTRETWSCFAANYTIETSQPLMIAKEILVKAQIPRLPVVAITQVAAV